MSLQAYLDNIKAKTGKTPDDFRALAAERGLQSAQEILAWLKTDYDLGYGHAGAIYYMIAHADDLNATPVERIETLFAGKKERWRPTYDALASRIGEFGDDVELEANLTYVNLRRHGKKFAFLQPSSAKRLDVGLRLDGVAAAGRLEAAGSWNAMVSHRVRISDPAEVDEELLSWLRQAYDKA